MTHSRGRLSRAATILAVAAILGGCAAGRAFRRGDSAARAGNWDAAVEQYRNALQKDPNKPEYQIALERAMINASNNHLDQARVLEARGQLEDALREYRHASELDPPNRQIAGKVTEMEHRIRDQAEAAQPRPSIQQLRDAARQAGPQPLVNLTTPLPVFHFQNSQLRDILNAIGQAAGINVAYDPTFADRTYSVNLDNVTLQEALNQLMTANQLFYTVTNPKSIIVSPDSQQKRNQYEQQVIRTFFISHADATELVQTINTIVRVGGGQLAPAVTANKTANTITIRATAAVADIIEKIIETNDKPRAELVMDVQILEVNRARAKQFGLDLSQYSINGVFSPETDPRGTTTSGTGTTATTSNTFNPQPFNLNSVSRGINTADFYLAVPSAVVRFLENDTETKLVAKPQLRGSEGQKLTLNLGEQIPIPSTTFTPIATGGANFNPLTSFNYKDVGVNVEITPRVTVEDDIIMDLVVESNARGADVNIGGQNLPSFTERKVTTRLRLRDGESNLLAGLLQDNERRSLTGLPGLIHIPILKDLLAANDNQIQQTDIVMLLTPRIIRTHELTQQDVSPIYIGTAQNLGVGGVPPLIAQPEPAPAQPAAAAPAPGAGVTGGAQAPLTPAGAQPNNGVSTAPQQGGVPIVPPGSSPIPGTTTAPVAPAAPTSTPAGTNPAAPVAGAAVAPAPGGVGGQIVVSPPGTEFRVGGGPYPVPVSVTGASRLSSLSLTLTYNPSVLRVRTVQEGSFMRAGGTQTAFTQQVDAASGRVDIAIVRPGDATGVAGTGLLSAILFDAIAPGPANLVITGTASAPGGGALGVQFAPAPEVTVR